MLSSTNNVNIPLLQNWFFGLIKKNMDCLWTFIERRQKPPEVFCKKRCSEKFPKFYIKTSVLESFFSIFAGLKSCNFVKNRLQHTFFSCEIWEIFKNTCFEEHLRRTASRRTTLCDKVILSHVRRKFSWYSVLSAGI